MADNSEKIEVYFKDGGPSGTQGPDLHWSQKSAEQASPSTENTKGLVDMIVGGFAFNLGKTVVSSAMARVGSYTGNYMAQNQINNLINGLGGLAVLSLSASTGSILPIVSYIGSAALKGMDYQMQVMQADIQSQAIANLAGISATGRSRGTGGKI